MRKVPRKRRGRDSFIVLADILTVCEERTRRSHIIYRANLSFDMLRQYVQLALKAGLLDENPADRTLLITAKGKAYLKEFEALTRLIGYGSPNQDSAPIVITS